MANKELQGYRPDHATPPGETIEEFLEADGMTQRELAKRLGLSCQQLNKIIKGKAPITSETAIKLEDVFGVDASFWNNLEMQYRESLARIREMEQLKAEEMTVSHFPYREMAKLGWVPETRKRHERVKNLRRFFSVASLDRVNDLAIAANFRRRHSSKISHYALAAWLRKGETEAREIATQPFSLASLKETIPSLRELTKEFHQGFREKVQEMCAACGVAITFVPQLPQTSVNGANQWLSPQKAVITLSDRYAFWGVFWFTFFHEVGHLVKQHGKKGIYIDCNDGHTGSQDEEQEADRFAADTLIPPREYRQFKAKGEYDDIAISAFAEAIGTHPSIVLGRLCHDGLAPWERWSSSRIALEEHSAPDSQAPIVVR